MSAGDARWARSTTFAGDPAAGEALAAELRRRFAPALAEAPDHLWVTSLDSGDGTYAVTSFWREEPPTQWRLQLEVLLEELGTASGCRIASQTVFGVRHTARRGPTAPGYRVDAASFECPGDVGPAVAAAVEVSRRAESLPGFNFAAVEVAEGNRVISVTTWDDEAHGVAGVAALAGGYGAAWPEDPVHRVGRVIYSSTDG